MYQRLQLGDLGLADLGLDSETDNKDELLDILM